ncbi:hypothetical protein IC757_02560 [Wenzhouxiangella sp. AB-CW3]|uniref:NAD-dependent epimerase/dehydratase family protein n=1 Tax=Wenzhouxiangella sp. AB-CW3 TaxID=2771012 RepID=UPI00168B9265|nr:hypothetical protein [Wenzhouxiangella sp. AB-CW3]QOC23060.1 hypothetical protein IC757_02560 [Wenzhouxiangella sp. AB-CW3]
MNGDPVILVTGASGAVAGALMDRTVGQGVRVLAVSSHGPQHSWPHVTWFEQDLERGPADVRAGTLVSLGALRHALAQVERGIGTGRVLAVSPALGEQLALVRGRKLTESDRELPQIEDRLRAACRERDITLTLLKPSLVYSGGDDGSFAPTAWSLSQRSVLWLGQGGLRQPVHADDLASLILRCLQLGDDSAGSWSLAGDETLSIAAMLERVASRFGVPIRRLPVPAWWARRSLDTLDLSPALRVDLAGLYGHDLLPDDSPARRRLGWQPQGFRP